MFIKQNAQYIQMLKKKLCTKPHFKMWQFNPSILPIRISPLYLNMNIPPEIEIASLKSVHKP